MIDILSLTREETEALCESVGEKRFRGKQVFDWLYKGVDSFSEMRNLPAGLIAALEQKAFIPQVYITEKKVSSVDGTVKYLISFSDGEAVESCVMRYNHGLSICISTQSGCRMGCSFCASTKAGLSRDLTPSEMLLQVMNAEKDLGERISNIVLMGIGEPLDNYENVLRFLRLVNMKDGLNKGYRHISLSTCGLCERIDALSEEGMPITLSVSLHAVTDEKRRAVMPIAHKYTVAELIGTCRRYIQKTGRRVAIEYAMIEGVNDTDEDALELARLLTGMLVHVNLIPVNTVEGTGYRKSRRESIAAFAGLLEKKGISVTVRRKLGSDIDASCGQLRASRSNKKA